jgi:type IV secretory pathway TrbD component
MVQSRVGGRLVPALGGAGSRRLVTTAELACSPWWLAWGLGLWSAGVAPQVVGAAQYPRIRMGYGRKNKLSRRP